MIVLRVVTPAAEKYPKAPFEILDMGFWGVVVEIGLPLLDMLPTTLK